MPQPRKHASNAGRQAAYRMRRAQARALAGSTTAAPGRPLKTPRLPQKPGTRRWQLLLTQAHDTVETVADEMQDYHDDRSEQWQEDHRGAAFTDRLEAVQDVATAFDNIPEQ